MPPKYTDQASCYAVSIILTVTVTSTKNRQSSQNCSSQTTTCYNSAGPTGSKNCHYFEAYCTKLRNGCESGDYKGPPSIAEQLPPPLETLNTAAVVYATGPVQSSTPTAASATRASTETLILTTTYSSSMAPVTAGSPAPSETGSVNACGNNGGQSCVSTMCCSSHG